MSDTNVIIIKGRLTAAPELNYFGTKNTAKLKFSLANNTGYGDFKKVNFFNCEMYGKSGEALERYLDKGTAIVVAGEMIQNRWETPEGYKKSAFKLVVKDLSFAGGANDNGSNESKPAQTPKAEPANPFAAALGGDDDIPF